MQFIKFNDRLGHLQELIRKEGTGTPKELANHLNISERMVYRYLNELKDMGKQIEFCRIKRSYKFISD
jgi:predicted DNA-binding transcriptional regulator YafY